LPLWDAYPLGWRDRTRVVEPRFAPWVYDSQGNASSLIIEEGRAIGLWQFRDGDSITLEFHIFEPYNNRLNAVRLAAEGHAAELAKVAGARDVRVIERALPAPLSDRPAASFLWPLGKEPIFRHSDSDFDSPMDRRERTPNVLRSKFLDDERLVRPMVEEEARREARKAGAKERATTTVDSVNEDGPRVAAVAKPEPKAEPKVVKNDSVKPTKARAVEVEEDEDVVVAAPAKPARKAAAKPEPKKPEPAKKVAVKAAKPEPVKAEPAKAAKAAKVEPVKAAKPEPKKAEPKKAEPKKPEPKKPEPKKAPAKPAAKPAAKKAPAKPAAKPAAKKAPAKPAAKPAAKKAPAKPAAKPAAKKAPAKKAKR
jgi:hypothetical protein